MLNLRPSRTIGSSSEELGRNGLKAVSIVCMVWVENGRVAVVDGGGGDDVEVEMHCIEIGYF